MIGTIAMTVDGILRRPIGGQPIEQGLAMYHGLKTTHNIVLLTDDEDPDPLADWLAVEGLSGYGKLCHRGREILAAPAPAARLHQVIGLQAANYAISFVYDPDPACTALLIRNGYNCATITLAAISLPSWLPGYQTQITPWDDLVEQAEQHARLRAEKERAGAVEE